MKQLNEKEINAFSHVLMKALVCIRSNSVNKIPTNQLFDVIDALHNIPLIISRTYYQSTDDYLRLYFSPYDDKWYGSIDDVLKISLVKDFNDFMKNNA